MYIHHLYVLSSLNNLILRSVNELVCQWNSEQKDQTPSSFFLALFWCLSDGVTR